MTESEKYHIDERTGQFTLKTEYKPKEHFLQYIPRYMEKENTIGYQSGINEKKSVSLQDLGWKNNLTGEIRNPIGEEGCEIIKVPIADHLVHFCERCQAQRCFKLVKEEKKTSSQGHEYVKGYWGYCLHCDDGEGCIHG